jgi:hypothetical protein
VEAKRIGVGTLDTGIDAGHPVLRNRLAGFLYVDEDGFADPCRNAFDSDVHGTHTATLVCGARRGRVRIGVGSNAWLYYAAVIEGGRVPVRMLVGLDWLLKQPLRVLHLPLGITNRTPLFLDVLESFRRRDVVVVCAIGNSGSGRADTPGWYPSVLSVGACDDDGNPAPFSGSDYDSTTEQCRKPDVLAPGVDILSAEPGGGWARNSGTSMASAYVAGLAAHLLEKEPSATAAQVTAAIIRSARPLEPDFRHRCRGGIADPKAALSLLRSNRGLRRPQLPAIDWNAEPRADPRLRRQMTMGVDGNLLEAIIMFHTPPRSRSSEADYAFVLKRAETIAKRKAKWFRVLPGNRHAVLCAHVRVLRALLADPAVRYLHSTELDVLGWSPYG